MRGLGPRARHEGDLVTSPSVEARPRASPVCWSEIRSLRSYPVRLQQGTYALEDGVDAWMASVAQDTKGDIAVGVTVCNGIPVFPGVRYTGRLKGDELNHLPPHLVRKPALSRLGVTAIACLWGDRLPLQGVGWLGAVGPTRTDQRPG